MKILIRNSDHVVIYAQPDLTLNESEARGDGWRDPNFTTANSTLLDADLPPLWTGAVWTYSAGVWAVHDTARQAELAATETLRLETIENARIASLWQAAHDYEFAQVSGSAIGLLAIGVMQSLPKCLAVQAWIKSIWTLYYTRKYGTSTDMDYSGAGDCPHSVPELMVELGL